MRAVVLERNPLVARKVVRYLAAGGVLAEPLEDPAALPTSGLDLVFGDLADADAIVAAARANGARGVLWTHEPLARALPFVAEGRGGSSDHVLARRDREATPEPRELLLVARRGGRAVPATPLTLSAFLDHGHAGLGLPMTGSADRDGAVARVEQFVAELHAPKRLAEMFAELAHELIMNAVYDAPPGRAHDRKAPVALAAHEQPRVLLGSDGSRLALQVVDPFGRLARAQLVAGLARGAAGGEQDRGNGGAGLGFAVISRAATALYAEVVAGRHTAVTAVLDLDANLRELRTRARSLHLWMPEGRTP